MTNFTTARINMVDSQIHPMGVVSEPILNAFRLTHREEFVPANSRGIAYSDEDMPVAAGRYLMEPSTHARLIQAAQPTADDTVLDIGCATGYSTAIFSRITASVVYVDTDATLLAQAETTLAKHNHVNVTLHQGPFAEGCATHGPYSLIFLNGSVGEVPQTLFDQLAPHGRMVAVIKRADDKIGRATLFLKSDHGSISERALFDAAVPYLPGHEPRNGFVF